MIKKNSKLKLKKTSVTNNLGYPQTVDSREKAIDSTRLDGDIPEGFRESLPNEMEQEKPNLTNWSEAENRSEDLIEERDPFIQQPELDTQIPPELSQSPAYKLYGQESDALDDNLAKRLAKERHTRKQKTFRKKKWS